METTLNNVQATQLQSYLAANPDLKQALDRHIAEKGVTLSEPELTQIQKFLNSSGKLDATLIPPNSGSEQIDYSNVNEKMADIQKSAKADMYAILTALYIMAQLQRKTGHAVRELSYQQRWQAMDNAIDHMRSASNMRFAAAMAQGAFQVGMGLVSIGAGAKGIDQARQANALKQQANKLEADAINPGSITKSTSQKQLTKAASEGEIKSQVEAPKATPQKDINNMHAKADFLSIQSQATIQNGQALGQVSMGLGSMIGGSINFAADGEQVAQKEDETAADRSQSMVDKENEFMHRMIEIISDIRQKMQAIEDSNNATAKKIWA